MPTPVPRGYIALAEDIDFARGGYIIPPILYLSGMPMGHTIREKKKLLNRVRRVAGRIEAIERALVDEEGCATVLHLIAAARGAINGLMSEVIEDQQQAPGA